MTTLYRGRFDEVAVDPGSMTVKPARSPLELLCAEDLEGVEDVWQRETLHGEVQPGTPRAVDDEGRQEPESGHGQPADRLSTLVGPKY